MNDVNKNKDFKVYTLINKIFNITNDEWPRIAISWTLQFLYRAGYIVGWTIFITMFITKFGIGGLPFFFLIYAFFRIIGSLVYTNVVNHFRKDLAIIITAFCGVLFTFLAFIFGFVSSYLFLFAGIAILAIFFVQLYILNSAFIEDQFSPLESERTFPIIESSETFGGITGGLLVTLFAAKFPPEYFAYVLMVCFALIIPTIFAHRLLIKKLPFIHFRKKKKVIKINFDQLKKNLSYMKHTPFLKVLFGIIFVQFVFTNLLEFQYTSAVYNDISANGATHVEEHLMHDLGSLQILFHSFALIMQLFVASRIISSLGIIASLLLHPVVSLLSLGGLFIKFGFSSAVITKANFEMTNIIYKNAYHTSYYAIDPKIRESIREVLDGLVPPIATICGMTGLIILQNILSAQMLTGAVTLIMIGLMICMLINLLKNENKYTQISVKNLIYNKDHVLQLNAVEVLGQKGHRNAAEILTKKLNEENLNKKVKIKILNTLGIMKDKTSILEIFECLKNEDKHIRLAALQAIMKFIEDKKIKDASPFSSFRTKRLLKYLFENETNKDIKTLIINVLASLNKKEIVPFIIDLLKSSDPRIKADCIAVCANFNDITIVHYIKKYLDSDDPVLKANTIITLWNYEKFRIELNQKLKEMLYSQDKKQKIEAYRVIGEINAIHEKNRLKDLLTTEDEETRFVVSIALAKLGDNSGIPYLANSILNIEEDVHKQLQKVKEILPENSLKEFEKVIIQWVSKLINDTLIKSNKKSLEELDKNTLLKLQKAYELVNEHEEVQNINEILSQRKETNLQFNPT